MNLSAKPLVGLSFSGDFLSSFPFGFSCGGGGGGSVFFPEKAENISVKRERSSRNFRSSSEFFSLSMTGRTLSGKSALWDRAYKRMSSRISILQYMKRGDGKLRLCIQW